MFFKRCLNSNMLQQTLQVWNCTHSPTVTSFSSWLTNAFCVFDCGCWGCQGPKYEGHIALLQHMLEQLWPSMAKPSSNGKVAAGQTIKKLTFLILYIPDFVCDSSNKNCRFTKSLRSLAAIILIKAGGQLQAEHNSKGLLQILLCFCKISRSLRLTPHSSCGVAAMPG
jgi:hypothetical protein